MEPTAKNKNRVRLVRTKRGARLLQDDAVLSEILAQPGPTHGWFDVLAACVSTLATEPGFLMLGFAGGGVVAPLRAMGYSQPIEAVDVSSDGQAVFQELSSSWAGEVTVHCSDAAAWLEHTVASYSVILDDLSVPTSRGVLKPTATLETLPSILAKRLRPGGAALFNLLPSPDHPWSAQTRMIGEPFSELIVVRDSEYENRILIGARELPAAGILAGDLRAHLERIDSKRSANLRLNTVRRR